MKLILHTSHCKSELSDIYRHALASAVELFIITAYLTEWDTSLKLNADCRKFRVIIGRDFGITKKDACRTLMGWLPPERKSQFMVADGISGFHPKVVFWKASNGRSFAIVGSSNLTRAAFETNYEANIHGLLTSTEYGRAKDWIKRIETQSVIVSEDWLKKYREMPPSHRTGSKPKGRGEPETTPIIAFKLPKPSGMSKIIAERRKQLSAYNKKKKYLTGLFRRCAAGKITPRQFYAELPKYWGPVVGDQIQNDTWKIRGKNSDFRALSRSFVAIIDAAEEDRDDVVVKEIDRLGKMKVPTRGSFLSEMLCLMFPDKYPLLNEPVQKYIVHAKFKAPRLASEGVRFLDLAKKLRFSLIQNIDHPARTLAELDAVIWAEYKEE